MGLEYHVLGGAGRDNALLVYVHTGQSVERLLFDCGDGTLTPLRYAEIQRIDHLCFSHLHMDHIGGFDSFFRCAYNRMHTANRIWGPPETARILHHRFQGFLWNLYADREASWQVCDVSPAEVACTRFELSEAFAIAHRDGTYPFANPLIATDDYAVETMPMDHQTTSMAYLVREKARLNIDKVKLAALNLPTGPWVKQVKKPLPGQTDITVDGGTFSIAELQTALLSETPGRSIAYLTDFRLDEMAMARLVPWLRDCHILVCESAYRVADADLAAQNYHMTTVQAAYLAQQAGAGLLILIHISDRYPLEAYPDILAEARAVFPETRFPKEWGV